MSRQIGPPLLLGEGWHPDSPGGLNRYLGDLLTALGAGGVEARAVVLGPAASAPPAVHPGGRADDPVVLRLWRYNRAVRRASEGAGLLDAHFALYAWWPAFVGRTRKLPLVVHFQGPWAEESRSVGLRGGQLWIKWLIEASVYRRADRLIVLSSAFKRLLVESYGVSPWKVEVIPPGVDLALFRPGDRAAARLQLGLAGEAHVALVVRRLVARMGLDTLLESWVQVAAKDPLALLLIAGDGPERGPLRSTADRLQITDAVQFLGNIGEGDLVSCYQAADVAVVPTRLLEGFGLVVLEALATGLPVVATDAGALPEVLAPLDPGLLVPTADAVGLAERLAGALDGTWPGPSAASCQRYAEGFSWEQAAGRHLEVYGTAQDDRGPKIRVVYLDHCAELSGGELALAHLLGALDNVEPHVILAEDGPLVAVLLQAGISVEVLPMSEAARSLRRDRLRGGRVPLAAAWSTARYTARLTRRLRQLQPDLVHANSLKAGICGGVAAKLTRLPFVWHLHDRVASDYLPSAAVRLVRAAVRILADVVIANSRTSLETLGSSGRSGVVIGCPVLAHEPWSRPAAGAADSAVLRVGMIGRLAPWKGQHIFLEAFAKAFPTGETEAVVIGRSLFGEAAYEQGLHDLTDRLGLSGRVQFRGFCPRVQAELERLDVLVHASVIPEPFGQVVLEGMAAGLAVIAGGAGGPAEVITDDVDGLLYTVGDATALATVLRRAATDGGLRRRLGAAARRRAAAFAPEIIAGEVSEVYQALLYQNRL
ncbi:MAG: glycosyltransferase family 4 protein [Acidimicrobiales bacterium]